MTGRMVSKYRGTCKECGHFWESGQMIYFNEGQLGFYDCEQCAEHAIRSVVVPVDAQTPVKTTITYPQPNIAVNATGTPLDARQEEIRAAHAENMRANEHLCTSIDFLSSVLADLRVAIQEWVKAVNK
jgi:hypothetical protein